DALKAGVGQDRVQLHTDDDEATIVQLAERWGITAGVHDGAVTFSVASGETFVPELFAGLGVPIRSVQVARPSLDDVFMAHTGRTIRDTEAAAPRLPPFALGGRR